MSDYEKARVYFTWICDNCVYDYSAGDSSLSHIAYSLFHNGTAVCDGYTGAYNLLLKLEGIDCTSPLQQLPHLDRGHPGRHRVPHRHHLGRQRPRPQLRLLRHDSRQSPGSTTAGKLLKSAPGCLPGALFSLQGLPTFTDDGPAAAAWPAPTARR